MLGKKYIQVLETVLGRVYADLEMANYVRPRTDINDRAATSWTQPVYDITGGAEEHNSLTMSAPPVSSRLVGTIGGEIRQYAQSFQWSSDPSLFDASTLAIEMAAAREFVERAVDTALQNGGGLSGGVKGLFNQSNGLTSTAAANWAAMTAAELYQELVTIDSYTAAQFPGIGSIQPNRLLVPASVELLLEQLMPNSATSVRNAFLGRSNGRIKRIDTASALSAASYVMAYTDEPTIVGAVLPVATTLRGQIPKEYGLSDQFYARVGGVYVSHPKAIHKRTISGI